MLHIFAIVAPVFGLLALGFAARASNYIPERTGEGLADFVYSIAIPCLIFKTLTSVNLPEAQPWGYWFAYFGAVAIVWAMGSALAKYVFDAAVIPRTIAGFAASQANTVLMGIPLILESFGPEGAVPLFLLVAVHLPIMIAVGTLLAEGRDMHWSKLLRQLLLHPILMSIFVSVAFKLAHLDVPEVLRSIVNQIGNAAIPCALFTMGMALRRYGIRDHLKLTMCMTFLKLVVHPALVMLLAWTVFDMPKVWAGVAVLFAASPVGINAYLFAERYKQGVGIASGAIALSTALSTVTITVWLIILGVGR
ncbi:MAG: AEC family transporter [Hyphomicrobiales bacterium]|nr:AEC family transporter [Hyphomicrobiales bacterium]